MTDGAPSDDHDEKADDSFPKFPIWMWLMLASASAVFVAWGLYMWRLNHDVVGAGQWADSFGPLTGALSGVALVFVVWSSHMQRRELDLTRKEMKLQREAAQESASEQKRANDLAEESNRLVAAQVAAQEMLTSAQTDANRIAEAWNGTLDQQVRTQRQTARAQRKANRLAQKTIALLEVQRAAQEHATRAQHRANSLASTAALIDISRSVLEAYRFAADTERGINIATVDKMATGALPIESNSNTGQAIAKAASHLIALRELATILEREDELPPD